MCRLEEQKARFASVTRDMPRESARLQRLRNVVSLYVCLPPGSMYYCEVAHVDAVNM
jgi:hypothetical protein